MSTRCQIIVKDEYHELWFYKHSDGYPERTLPLLEKFLSWVKEGKIRDNVEQASGWLILIGAKSYNKKYVENHGYVEKTMEELFEPPSDHFSGWKCGAFEPSVPEQHGDIEYLYTVDLDKLTITYKEI